MKNLQGAARTFKESLDIVSNMITIAPYAIGLPALAIKPNQIVSAIVAISILVSIPLLYRKRYEIKSAFRILLRLPELVYIRINPKVAYFNRGTYYLNMLDIDRARTDFSRCLMINAKYGPARRALHICDLFEQYQAGNNSDEEMLAVVERELHIKSSDPHLLMLKGVILTYSDPDGAIEVLQRAIRIERKLTMAHFQLGLICDLAKSFGEAESLYKRAYELSKWEPVFCNNIAHVNYQAGRFREAILLYRYTITLNHYFILPQCTLGMSLWFVGDFNESLRVFRRLDVLLGEDEVLQNAVNQPFAFHHIKQGVVFFDLEMKIMLARICLAVTYALIGDHRLSKEVMEGVNKDNPTRQSMYDVMMVMDYNLHRLIISRTEYACEIRKFISDYVAMPLEEGPGIPEGE